MRQRKDILIMNSYVFVCEIQIYISTFSRFSGKSFSLTRILINVSALQNVHIIEEADEPAREATCCKR